MLQYCLCMLLELIQSGTIAGKHWVMHQPPNSTLPDKGKRRDSTSIMRVMQKECEVDMSVDFAMTGPFFFFFFLTSFLFCQSWEQFVLFLGDLEFLVYIVALVGPYCYSQYLWDLWDRSMEL